MRPPASVYRLQLGPGLGFAEARERLRYLHALGADGLYLSPCLQAAPGSAHGYDVVDFNRVSAALGGEEAFLALLDEARGLGLKVLLDWVPNHMSTADDNALWADVLENGRASAYARFFDIDWSPPKPELKDKVLLPVLPDLYGRVLDDGGLALALRDGALRVEGAGRSLPLAPETYPAVLEHGLDAKPDDDPDRDELLSILTAFRNLPGAEPDRAAERAREKEVAKRRLAGLAERSEPVRLHLQAALAAFNDRRDPSRLDALLARQHYRLAHWKVASQEINYRRFFNVNDLAGLRMEEEAVFRHCHRLLLRLVAEGRVDGLRIDHVDGLYDPAGYLARLQGACAAALEPSRLEPGEDFEQAGSRLALGWPRGARPFYIVVEKILGRHETLPEGWPVHGTVGYDFLNALGGLYVDPERRADIDSAYESFTGHRVDIDRLVYSTKKLFAAEYMASEVLSLGHRLGALNESSRHYRDYTRHQLTFALRELVDCFPVYRTYIAPADDAPSERDAQTIRIAVEKAKKRTPSVPPDLYDFLSDLLLLRLGPPRIAPATQALYRDLALRFQQLTGPIMAKGLEDTAFYADSRLLCLNEVGGDPAHVGVSPQDFHKQNAERASAWPQGLLPTSTHDTKRSEDARLRIAALSELAVPWRAAAARWCVVNAKHKTELEGRPEPSGDAEYFIYQTLLGIWSGEPMSEGERAHVLERLWDYSLKAVREAQRETNWVNPNTAYEAAVRRFLEGLLDPAPENRFAGDFGPFAARVAELGRLNSLSALALKLASPGVVDTYQGCELWNYRLVDPDNRRPPDWDLAERGLAEALALPPEEAARRLFAERADGRIKLLLLHRGLDLRRREPALFLGTDYLALRAEGERARHVVAFARRADGKVAIAAAGRFFAELAPEGGTPTAAAWGDTALLLPAGLEASGLRDAFTGRSIETRPHAEGAAIPLAELFEVLPCVLLTTQAAFGGSASAGAKAAVERGPSG